MTPQNQLILNHLKEVGPLTPLEALREYGCFRLGARIYDLKRDGHVINSERIELANGKHCAQYSYISEASA